MNMLSINNNYNNINRGFAKYNNIAFAGGENTLPPEDAVCKDTILKKAPLLDNNENFMDGLEFNYIHQGNFDKFINNHKFRKKFVGRLWIKLSPLNILEAKNKGVFADRVFADGEKINITVNLKEDSPEYLYLVKLKEIFTILHENSFDLTKLNPEQKNIILKEANDFNISYFHYKEYVNLNKFHDFYNISMSPQGVKFYDLLQMSPKFSPVYKKLEEYRFNIEELLENDASTAKLLTEVFNYYFSAACNSIDIPKLSYEAGVRLFELHAEINGNTAGIYSKETTNPADKHFPTMDTISDFITFYKESLAEIHLEEFKGNDPTGNPVSNYFAGIDERFQAEDTQYMLMALQALNNASGQDAVCEDYVLSQETENGFILPLMQKGTIGEFILFNKSSLNKAGISTNDYMPVLNRNTGKKHFIKKQDLIARGKEVESLMHKVLSLPNTVVEETDVLLMSIFNSAIPTKALFMADEKCKEKYGAGVITGAIRAIAFTGLSGKRLPEITDKTQFKLNLFKIAEHRLTQDKAEINEHTHYLMITNRLYLDTSFIQGEPTLENIDKSLACAKEVLFWYKNKEGKLEPMKASVDKVDRRIMREVAFSVLDLDGNKGILTARADALISRVRDVGSIEIIASDAIAGAVDGAFVKARLVHLHCQLNLLLAPMFFANLTTPEARRALIDEFTSIMAKGSEYDIACYVGFNLRMFHGAPNQMALLAKRGFNGAKKLTLEVKKNAFVMKIDGKPCADPELIDVFLRAIAENKLQPNSIEVEELKTKLVEFANIAGMKPQAEKPHEIKPKPADKNKDNNQPPKPYPQTTALAVTPDGLGVPVKLKLVTLEKPVFDKPRADKPTILPAEGRAKEIKEEELSFLQILIEKQVPPILEGIAVVAETYKIKNPKAILNKFNRLSDNRKILLTRQLKLKNRQELQTYLDEYIQAYESAKAALSAERTVKDLTDNEILFLSRLKALKQPYLLSIIALAEKCKIDDVQKLFDILIKTGDNAFAKKIGFKNFDDMRYHLIFLKPYVPPPAGKLFSMLEIVFWQAYQNAYIKKASFHSIIRRLNIDARTTFKIYRGIKNKYNKIKPDAKQLKEATKELGANSPEELEILNAWKYQGAKKVTSMTKILQELFKADGNKNRAALNLDLGSAGVIKRIERFLTDERKIAKCVKELNDLGHRVTREDVIDICTKTMREETLGKIEAAKQKMTLSTKAPSAKAPPSTRMKDVGNRVFTGNRIEGNFPGERKHYPGNITPPDKKPSQAAPSQAAPDRLSDNESGKPGSLAKDRPLKPVAIAEFKSLYDLYGAIEDLIIESAKKYEIKLVNINQALGYDKKSLCLSLNIKFANQLNCETDGPAALNRINKHIMQYNDACGKHFRIVADSEYKKAAADFLSFVIKRPISLQEKSTAHPKPSQPSDKPASSQTASSRTASAKTASLTREEVQRDKELKKQNPEIYAMYNKLPSPLQRKFTFDLYLTFNNLLCKIADQIRADKDIMECVTARNNGQSLSLEQSNTIARNVVNIIDCEVKQLEEYPKKFFVRLFEYTIIKNNIKKFVLSKFSSAEGTIDLSGMDFSKSINTWLGYGGGQGKIYVKQPDMLGNRKLIIQDTERVMERILKDIAEKPQKAETAAGDEIFPALHIPYSARNIVTAEMCGSVFGFFKKIINDDVMEEIKTIKRTYADKFRSVEKYEINKRKELQRDKDNEIKKIINAAFKDLDSIKPENPAEELVKDYFAQVKKYDIDLLTDAILLDLSVKPEITPMTVQIFFQKMTLNDANTVTLTREFSGYYRSESENPQAPKAERKWHSASLYYQLNKEMRKKVSQEMYDEVSNFLRNIINNEVQDKVRQINSQYEQEIELVRDEKRLGELQITWLFEIKKTVNEVFDNLNNIKTESPKETIVKEFLIELQKQNGSKYFLKTLYKKIMNGEKVDNAILQLFRSMSYDDTKIKLLEEYSARFEGLKKDNPSPKKSSADEPPAARLNAAWDRVIGRRFHDPNNDDFASDPLFEGAIRRELKDRRAETTPEEFEIRQQIAQRVAEKYQKDIPEEYRAEFEKSFLGQIACRSGLLKLAEQDKKAFEAKLEELAIDVLWTGKNVIANNAIVLEISMFLETMGKSIDEQLILVLKECVFRKLSMRDKLKILNELHAANENIKNPKTESEKQAAITKTSQFLNALRNTYMDKVLKDAEKPNLLNILPDEVGIKLFFRKMLAEDDIPDDVYEAAVDIEVLKVKLSHVPGFPSAKLDYIPDNILYYFLMACEDKPAGELTKNKKLLDDVAKRINEEFYITNAAEKLKIIFKSALKIDVNMKYVCEIISSLYSWGEVEEAKQLKEEILTLSQLAQETKSVNEIESIAKEFLEKVLLRIKNLTEKKYSPSSQKIGLSAEEEKRMLETHEKYEKALAEFEQLEKAGNEPDNMSEYFGKFEKAPLESESGSIACDKLDIADRLREHGAYDLAAELYYRIAVSELKKIENMSSLSVPGLIIMCGVEHHLQRLIQTTKEAQKPYDVIDCSGGQDGLYRIRTEAPPPEKYVIPLKYCIKLYENIVERYKEDLIGKVPSNTPLSEYMILLELREELKKYMKKIDALQKQGNRK